MIVSQVVLQVELTKQFANLFSPHRNAFMTIILPAACYNVLEKFKMEIVALTITFLIVAKHLETGQS